jgi:hypothetical protein
VRAFEAFGHSSDRHLQLFGYLVMERGASLVLCIGYVLPSHFVGYLAAGKGTSRMLYSYEMMRETLQQEKNKNLRPAVQGKAPEELCWSGGSRWGFEGP